MNPTLSESSVSKWYHGKINRIPLMNRKYKKKVFTNTEILALFDGTVLVEEKVDGKLTCTQCDGHTFLIEEDISGKHTVHNHILQYKNPPKNKRVYLDLVEHRREGGLHVSKPIFANSFMMASVRLFHPTIEQIYSLLYVFSRRASVFGCDHIEGLIIKNYDKQLFGKYINAEFEDELNEQT